MENMLPRAYQQDVAPHAQRDPQLSMATTPARLRILWRLGKGDANISPL
jgi:hypothetical protein